MVRVDHSDSNEHDGFTIERVGESEQADIINDLMEWELDGDKYKIVKLIRYPSYDFLFAVPLTHNNMHPSEVGLFQVRFRDVQRATGYLIDANELIDIIDGFVAIYDDFERTQDNEED